jgi:hypothetical protein
MQSKNAEGRSFGWSLEWLRPEAADRIPMGRSMNRPAPAHNMAFSPRVRTLYRISVNNSCAITLHKLRAGVDETRTGCPVREAAFSIHSAGG